MMTNFDLRVFGKTAAALLLGVALAASPALAEKGGNGKGGNGGNAGGGASSKSQSSNGGGAKSQSGKSAKAAKPAKADGDSGVSASSFGNINGFLHASPDALANASENSLIGRVTLVYGAQLRSYLNGTVDETEPTLEGLRLTLEDIANKEVTPEMIAAINEKLVATDAELAGLLASSGKSLSDLAIEVDTGTPVAPVLSTGEETTEVETPDGDTAGTL